MLNWSIIYRRTINYHQIHQFDWFLKFLSKEVKNCLFKPPSTIASLLPENRVCIVCLMFFFICKNNNSTQTQKHTHIRMGDASVLVDQIIVQHTQHFYFGVYFSIYRNCTRIHLRNSQIEYCHNTLTPNTIMCIYYLCTYIIIIININSMRWKARKICMEFDCAWCVTHGNRKQF